MIIMKYDNCQVQELVKELVGQDSLEENKQQIGIGQLTEQLFVNDCTLPMLFKLLLHLISIILDCLIVC